MKHWHSVAILLLVAHCATAQVVTPIQDSMNPQELQATGLATLTPAQLDALNSWLQQHGATGDERGANAAPAPAPGDTQSTAAPANDGWGKRAEPTDVVSRISGTFTGWSGNTVFTLDNGQVYQQRRPGSWRTRLENPEVRVGRRLMGVLELEVDGHSIGVKRLR